MMAIITIVDEDGCVIVENRRCEPQKEWINEGARTKTARFSFEITRVLIPQKSLFDEFIGEKEKQEQPKNNIVGAGPDGMVLRSEKPMFVAPDGNIYVKNKE